MTQPVPGEYQPLRDRWGPFATLFHDVADHTLVLADRRVLRLHPEVGRAISAYRLQHVLPIQAGEGAKSLKTLQRVLSEAVPLPRTGTLLAIGGGTLGDLATVAAHLIKRGIRLVHVPTTLLAAIDSSVGGKGALHVSGERGRVVKNAAGVFHYPQETWLCPELYRSLDDQQRREGYVEAWKMAVCLDPSLWRRCTSNSMTTEQLIRAARALKDSVCRDDPYERSGTRQILNFGHTFGHVLETVTRFKLSHGDAVSLGILCALDVGRARGVTPPEVADSVESAFAAQLRAPDRRRLKHALQRQSPGSVRPLLLADKKVTQSAQVKMVLLRAVGSTEVMEIPDEVWRRCFERWRAGGRL